MLADSLGRHPDLYITPKETKIIPFLAKKYGDGDDLNQDQSFFQLWAAIAAIPSFRKLNGGVPPSIPENWHQFPRELAAVLDAFFRRFAAKDGKKRWGEKTPQHVQHIKKLHALYPKAKFIHIIRDGRDCAASFHRRWQRTPEYTIYRWKNVVQEGRKQGQEIGQLYFEIKYEELTANPTHWMQKLCCFLSLPFDEKVLKSKQPQMNKSQELRRIVRNSGRWRVYFNTKQKKKLESIAGVALKSLHYPINYRCGARDPSSIQLLCWRWRDYVMQFFYELIKKLNGTNHASWHRIFVSVQTAIKQFQSNKY